MSTFHGGRVVTDQGWEKTAIHFEDGVITESSSGSRFDVEGLIVSPGLIDLQINGAFGHDFTQDPTTIWKVGELLPQFGVTAFVPTIVTSPAETTDLALDVVGHRRPEGYRGAEVLGLHFEGPWISPEMHGAHNPEHIVDPDPEVAARWADSRLVSIVTLAPELPGAGVAIETLRTAGVVVSIGHTAADFATATDALSSGATTVTHLFNQMTPLHHRDPGVVGAALLAARHCLLIVDGLHIADGALEIAWQLLGEKRAILVTDAMAALGLDPGTYHLGDGPIVVGADGPRTADGRLAGSVVTLPRAIRNLASTTSAGPRAALRCASANPATALGLVDHGDLRHGSRADFTLFDDDLNVVSTYIGGERVFG